MEEIVIKQTGLLEFNFEKAKKELDEQIAPYRNLVFTEETKKGAKETVAQLRKEQKALNDQIKEVKKEYMRPFEEFSAKAMELIGLYEEPISFINGQVKAFDEDRKAEKKKLILEVYEDIMGDDEIKASLPLATIYNPKWENATFAKKAIAEEIMNIKQKAKSGLEAIKSFGSDKENEAIQMFWKNGFDLVPCVQYLQNYETQKAEILKAQEEKKKAEELERIRAEERAKLEAEQQKEIEIAEAVQKAQEEAIEALIPEETDEEVKEYTYMIRMTESTKNVLETYMNSIGVEFGELVF